VSQVPPAVPTETFPFRFLIVTFVVSVAIGVAIIYYGMHGQIGGGIP
jgi:hypothetical protein